MAAVGVWAVYFKRASAPTPMEDLYTNLVSAGFVPEFVCETDEQFGDWTYRNYGERIVPDADKHGVQLVGWTYNRVLSGYSAALLARAEGREVLVVMDRTALVDEAPQRPHDPGLNLYKKTIGSVVLYELTPLDRPAVLRLLRAGETGG